MELALKVNASYARAEARILASLALKSSSDNEIASGWSDAAKVIARLVPSGRYSNGITPFFTEKNLLLTLNLSAAMC